MDVFFIGEPVPVGAPADRFRIEMRAGARLIDCTITGDAVQAAAGRAPRTMTEAVEMFRRHEGRFCRAAAGMLARGQEPPSACVITSDDIERQGR